MTLKFLDGPPQAFALVKKRASRRLDLMRQSGAKDLGGAKPGELLVGSKPTRVYTLRIPALREQSSLVDSADPTGWRYLLMRGETVVGAADLTEMEGGEVKDGGVFSGGFEQAMGDVLLGAARMEMREPMEPRILTLPPLFHFAAVWLHGDSENLLLPVPPVLKGIDEKRTYSWGELRPILRARLDEIERDERANSEAVATT